MNVQLFKRWSMPSALMDINRNGHGVRLLLPVMQFQFSLNLISMDFIRKLLFLGNIMFQLRRTNRTSMRKYNGLKKTLKLREWLDKIAKTLRLNTWRKIRSTKMFYLFSKSTLLLWNTFQKSQMPNSYTPLKNTERLKMTPSRSRSRLMTSISFKNE